LTHFLPPKVSSPREGGMRSGGVTARGRGRGSRMASPHIDPELELGTKTG